MLGIAWEEVRVRVRAYLPIYICVIDIDATVIRAVLFAVRRVVGEHWIVFANHFCLGKKELVSFTEMKKMRKCTYFRASRARSARQRSPCLHKG